MKHIKHPKKRFETGKLYTDRNPRSNVRLSYASHMTNKASAMPHAISIYRLYIYISAVRRAACRHFDFPKKNKAAKNRTRGIESDLWNGF